MVNAIFTLLITGKRDLLRARQLVRRAAALLGFDAGDQMCLAAAAFDIACQIHLASGETVVSLEVAEGCFSVVCATAPDGLTRAGEDRPSVRRISKRLPADASANLDDVPWMLTASAELAPLEVFDEMRQLNQELLRALLDLARQRGVQEIYFEPSAA
jgi:hypothetical protein